MAEFIIFRTPTRPDMPEGPTEEEVRLIGEHFEYLEKAHHDGKLLLAGRTTEAPFMGISILRAESREEAETFIANDPAVVAGIFQVRLQPYRISFLGS